MINNRKWDKHKKEFVRYCTGLLKIERWDAGRIYDDFNGDVDKYDWDELYGLSWNEMKERMNMWCGRDPAENYDGPDEEYYMEQQELWLEQQRLEGEYEGPSYEFDSPDPDEDCSGLVDEEPQRWPMGSGEESEYETTIDETGTSEIHSYSWGMVEQSKLAEDDHSTDETKVIVEDHHIKEHSYSPKYVGRGRNGDPEKTRRSVSWGMEVFERSTLVGSMMQCVSQSPNLFRIPVEDIKLEYQSNQTHCYYLPESTWGVEPTSKNNAISLFSNRNDSGEIVSFNPCGNPPWIMVAKMNTEC